MARQAALRDLSTQGELENPGDYVSPLSEQDLTFLLRRG